MSFKTKYNACHPPPYPRYLGSPVYSAVRTWVTVGNSISQKSTQFFLKPPPLSGIFQTQFFRRIIPKINPFLLKVCRRPKIATFSLFGCFCQAEFSAASVRLKIATSVESCNLWKHWKRTNRSKLLNFSLFCTWGLPKLLRNTTFTYNLDNPQTPKMVANKFNTQKRPKESKKTIKVILNVVLPHSPTLKKKTDL